MKVTCPSCRTTYNIDDSRLPAGGAKLKCAKCQSTFPVKPGAEAEAIPLPEPKKPEYSRTSTVEMPAPVSQALREASAIPLPGGEDSGAIPLPPARNANRMGFGFDEPTVTRTRPAADPFGLDAPPAQDPADDFGAVPLPAAGEPSGAIPLPGAEGALDRAPDEASEAIDFGSDPTSQPGAIPLPGGHPTLAFGGRGASHPAFEESDPDAATRAIPLPGADPFGFDPPPAPAPAVGGHPDDDAIPFADEDAVPLPGTPGPASRFEAAPAPQVGGGAIPLPGARQARSEAAFGETDFDQPTRVMQLPDPHGAGLEAEEPTASAAIPLPSSTDFRPEEADAFAQPAHEPEPFGEDLSDDQATRMVPLPGNGEPAFADDGDFASVDPEPPVQLPPPVSDLDDPFDQPTRAVPNPLRPPQSAGGFDFAALEPTPAPAGDDGFAPFGSSAPQPASGAFAAFDALPPLEGEPVGATAVTTVPLPGAAAAPAHDDFGDGDTFNEPTRVAAIPDLDKLRAASLHSDPSRIAPVAPPPLPPSADPFGALPSIAPAVPGGNPFAEFPSPAEAAPPADPFSDLPSPADAAPAADPFAQLPPAGAAPAADPFGDLPSPADAPASLDPFADLPSPAEPAPASDNPFAAVSTEPAPSFNPSVDFGGVDLPGEPEPAPAGDDPFAAISLDPHETKQVPSGERQHHLRKRSGQTSGPFGEEKILGMIASGELVGNEEISPDGARWSPIGSVPAFQAAIEEAAGVQKPAPKALGEEPMDRIQQMYGGRMAGFKVVQRKDPLVKVRRLVKPLLIGASLAAVVGAGLSVGFTRYGVFGIKWISPARIAAGTPASAEIQSARKAISSDTFQGYKKARTSAEKVLAIREYPEARAVWCQAIFYLQRRYAAATPGEVQLAEQALEDIELLGRKNPDVAKAFAGAALAGHRPQDAVPLLQEAIARDPSNDPELSLLLAEAISARGQPKDAISTLERLVARGVKSAKAFHALGDLYQQQGDAAKATKAYQQALAIDPQHVISDVELAAVELLVEKKVDEAQKALDTALDATNRNLMGPAELARARALQGYALAEQFKLPEAVEALQDALKSDKDALFAKATLARVYLAQHDFAKALPLYEDAAKRDPRNLEYTDGYLSSLIATGKMSDALNAVAEASARFPDNARIAFLTARVNDALEHSAEAERHYRRAISADPKMVDAYLYLGRLYLRSRRLDDAKSLLETAAEKAPDSASVHAGLGELRLAQGDAASAEAEFLKATQLDPNLAEGHLGLAGVDLALAKLDVAKTEADKALALDAHLQNGHLELGRILWRQGDLKGALAALELAKQETPDSSPVAVAMGAVKLEQGDLAGAESSLLIALERDPLSAEARYYLGQVKLAEGQVSQAVDQLHAALERSPKKAAYHYQMGVALKASKDVSTAITEWQTAVQLDPKNADAYEALGKTFLDQGRFDDAVAAFESSLKADPQRSRVYGLEGDCYFQATRWKEAIARYQAAVKADPKLVAVYYKIGRSYGESGQPEEAIRWYQKATETDPDNAMPYYYLGFAYKEHGKKKDAIAAFQRYLAKKPDAPDRRDIEDEIYDLQQP